MRPLHPVLRFTLLCSAIVLGVLAVAWAYSGFSAFGMGPHGVAAMTIGSVLAVVLGTALMGLLFHSEHLRADAENQSPHRKGLKID